MSGTMCKGTAKQINVPHIVRSGRRWFFIQQVQELSPIHVCLFHRQQCKSCETQQGHAERRAVVVDTGASFEKSKFQQMDKHSCIFLVHFHYLLTLTDDYSLHRCSHSIQPTS